MAANKSSRKVGKTGEATFLGVHKGGTILIYSKWPQYSNECTFHSYDVIAKGDTPVRHYFDYIMLGDTPFLLTYMTHFHSVKIKGKSYPPLLAKNK